MATRSEHPEKYGWWLNELESLGVSTKRINECNDLKEISTLTTSSKGITCDGIFECLDEDPNAL